MHITHVWWTVNGSSKWRWKVKMGKKKKTKGKELTCLPSLFSRKQFSRSVVSNSLRPHGLQHSRLPCPSPTPRASSNSCPSSQWCPPNISSSVIPFPIDLICLLFSHLSCVWVFVTSWTAIHQASLSFTISLILLKLMSIESVMPSDHLILCCPLVLLPSIFPSMRLLY